MFKDVKFGDLFVCRDGVLASINCISANNDNLISVLREGGQCCYTVRIDNGKQFDYKHSYPKNNPYDIVSCYFKI